MTPAPLRRGFFVVLGLFMSVIRNPFLIIWYHHAGGDQMVRTAVIVRAIRRQMGWARKDMARVMGVSAACVGRVERGEQKLEEDAAKRLCEAAGAKLSRIL
jgi:predicted transcriptional regulator